MKTFITLVILYCGDSNPGYNCVKDTFEPEVRLNKNEIVLLKPFKYHICDTPDHYQLTYDRKFKNCSKKHRNGCFIELKNKDVIQHAYSCDSLEN